MRSQRNQIVQRLSSRPQQFLEQQRRSDELLPKLRATVSGLAVEAFFPADENTAAYLLGN